MAKILKPLPKTTTEIQDLKKQVWTVENKITELDNWNRKNWTPLRLILRCWKTILLGLIVILGFVYLFWNSAISVEHFGLVVFVVTVFVTFRIFLTPSPYASSLVELKRKRTHLGIELRNRNSGLEGERLVAEQLSLLPNNYKIINDVTIGGRQLDHIVIGPTGILVIETKYTIHYPSRNPYKQAKTGVDIVTNITGVQAIPLIVAAHPNARWKRTSQPIVRVERLRNYIMSLPKQLEDKDIEATAKKLL